jgi:hypothetical protein
MLRCTALNCICCRSSMLTMLILFALSGGLHHYMAHVDLYSEALVSSHFKQVGRTLKLNCISAGEESRIQCQAWTSRLPSPYYHLQCALPCDAVPCDTLNLISRRIVCPLALILPFLIFHLLPPFLFLCVSDPFRRPLPPLPGRSPQGPKNRQHPSSSEQST